MLKFCSLFLSIGMVASQPAACCLWGAIRWDAFVNSSSGGGDPDASVGAIVARVLTPPAWNDRLPWYSWYNSTAWTFDGTARSIMDTEIRMAVAAGIDHWVFDVYPPTLDLSDALASYQASTIPEKAELFFALLLQSSWMTSGGLAAWPEKVAIYGAHFARPDYRLVLGDRPLVYLFSVNEGDWGNATAAWQDWATALSALDAAARSAGRGAVYFVIQTWEASQGAAQLRSINAAAGGPLVSALSSYNLGGATDSGTPWDTFADAGEAFWDSLAATGANVVPPVAAGWDDRPRNMTPVPWQKWTDPAYVVGPTPAQLGAFVARARNWTDNNPSANPARVHLLSAWNEYDEGHWIGAVLPQFGGNARLEAIGSVLRGTQVPIDSEGRDENFR